MSLPRSALALFAAPLVLALGCASSPPAASPVAGPVAERAGGALDRLSGLERRAGLIDLYLDRSTGKLLALLPEPDAGGRIGRFLYVEGILTGLGSNPVGLDRG